MKIWILFHGVSDPDHPEGYECRRLCEEARRRGAIAEILNPEDFDLIIDSTDEWRAVYKGQYIDAPDVIIPRTGAETTYTGFAVLRFYQGLGIPVVNDVQSIRMAADKLRAHQALANNGFPIPRTMLGKFPPDMDMIQDKIGFPLIIKTLSGTRGGGVFLAESRQKFRDLTDLIAQANTNVHFIFQEYVRSSHGRDVRVFVAGGKVIACMERRSTDGGFKSNLSLGGAGQPFPTSPEIEDMALGVSKVIGLDVAGIDLLFDEGGFSVCEANSSPGFHGLEEACGVNAAAEIINIALRKGRGKRRWKLW